MGCLPRRDDDKEEMELNPFRPPVHPRRKYISTVRRPSHALEGEACRAGLYRVR